MSNQDLLSRDVWNILGLPFDKISLDESKLYVQNAIESKTPTFISTPNLNFVVGTKSDPDFFQSVVDSDLSLADGMPLIWVAKLLNIPITERVAGSSLFEQLASDDSVKSKIKVFFFGGQEGVAEIAHQQLNLVGKGMGSCGYYDPGFVSVDEMSSAKVVDIINAAEPDFIVVALGAKKGQQWIQKNRSQLTAPVISHLGAVINFVAGHVERAPRLWQNLGLEWLWRVRQESSLWRRYLFDGFSFCKLLLIHVFPLAIYDRIMRWKYDDTKPHFSSIQKNEKVEIKLAGSIYNEVLMDIRYGLTNLVDNSYGDVLVDCLHLDYIDSAFIATIMLFEQYIKEKNRELIIVNLPFKVRVLLVLHGVIERFAIKGEE